MKIEIKRIDNGLLVEFQMPPTSMHPLGITTGLSGGPLFAHDGTELMGFIAERVAQIYGFQPEGKE